MSVTLSEQDLDLEMERYPTEFDKGFRESAFEWVVGSWSLSKAHKKWRIGWSHELSEAARWTAYAFQWRGDDYIGLVFDSGGDSPPWYMAGWYRPRNAAVANDLVAFLNAEIADRLSGRASKYNGRVGREQDRLDVMYAYEDEVELRKNARQLGLSAPLVRPEHVTSSEGPRSVRVQRPDANASAKEIARATANASGRMFENEFRVVAFDREQSQAEVRDYGSFVEACRASDFEARSGRLAFVLSDHLHLMHYAVPRSSIDSNTAKAFDDEEIAGRRVAQSAGSIRAGCYRLVILDGDAARTRDFSHLRDACSFARGMEPLVKSEAWKPVLVFDDAFAVVDRVYPDDLFA